MSLNNSRRSYDDCFGLFDRALEADRGIRIEVDDIRAANYLRMRMHHARTIDRRDNKLIYPDPEDAMHGRSIYDVFVIRIDGIAALVTALERASAEEADAEVAFIAFND